MNFVRHKSLKGFLSSFFLRVISFQRALWTIRVRVNVHANPILAKLNSFFFFFLGEMSGKAIHFAGVWSRLVHWRVTMNCPPKSSLMEGREPWGREKFSFSTSLSCLKEMWVGSAGEAWRLMLQKGALTAALLVRFSWVARLVLDVTFAT